MKFLSFLAASGVSLILSAAPVGSEIVVIPVVANHVEGQSGSVWETEVRISRSVPTEVVRVRRAWVALPGGGSADDPATAPAWSLGVQSEQTQFDQILILRGADLLEGQQGGVGAVGLDIQGSVDVRFRIADTRGRVQDPPRCCWTGAGSLLAPPSAPLSGPSRIPFQTSGTGEFRTNVGIVNPTDSALTVVLRACSYSPDVGGDHVTGWPVSADYLPVPVVVPAYGWLQLSHVFARYLLRTCDVGCVFRTEGRMLPHVFGLEPETDAPYYAYSSLIDEHTNDATLTMATPGGWSCDRP